MANKRIRKKWKKRCTKCLKYKHLHNWFCPACSRLILRPAVLAASYTVLFNPGASHPPMIKDSKDRIWVWCGLGPFGGFRTNLDHFSEMVLEPWMVWAGKLSFQAYFPVDEETPK